LGPVTQPPKQRKVYTKNELLVIGKLPICSVAHPGKSPSEIIEEYNLQYAQQEKEIAKLQEEENSHYKQSHHNLHSSYPFLSNSYDSDYTNLSNSMNFFYSNGNNSSFRTSSVDGLNNNIVNNNVHLNNSMLQSPSSKNNNKKAWIPRKSADSLDISSPESLNFSSLQLDQPQPRIVSNKASTIQSSPKSYNYYYNNNNNHNDFLHSSQQQRVQVIHSTEYDETDQNEYSDEENEGFEDALRYSILQEISPKRLDSRQKQIDIGKNTPGYKNYLQLIKKEKRKYYDPHTPDKYQVCSKRSWDGQIRVWRRLLHLYDSKKADSETETKKES
jgi:histone RNA hairpin-binding protein